MPPSLQSGSPQSDRLPPGALGQAWKVASFAEFWPLYLQEHRRPLTRHLHVAGTLAGVALVVASFFGGPWLALLGIVAGYLLAWIAHFAVERNRPATFSHPLWSLAGDVRMTGLFLAGRLEDELRRHGIGLP